MPAYNELSETLNNDDLIKKEFGKIYSHLVNELPFTIFVCYFSYQPSELKFILKTTAAITAVHGYVPDYVLSNEVLETMVDTNSEWIETRTGVKERRILKGKGLGTSDMAVEAIKGILKKKNISP